MVHRFVGCCSLGCHKYHEYHGRSRHNKKRLFDQLNYITTETCLKHKCMQKLIIFAVPFQFTVLYTVGMVLANNVAKVLEDVKPYVCKTKYSILGIFVSGNFGGNAALKVC